MWNIVEFRLCWFIVRRTVTFPPQNLWHKLSFRSALCKPICIIIVCAQSLSCVLLSATPWTIACQTSLSMGSGVGCHFLFHRIFLTQRPKPTSLAYYFSAKKLQMEVHYLFANWHNCLHNLMFRDEVKHNDIKLSLWKTDQKVLPFLSAMVNRFSPRWSICMHT